MVRLINNKLSLAPLNKMNKSIIFFIIIFTITTISLFIFSSIRGGNIAINFNNINYNPILILISKIGFWFSIGIKLYLEMSKGKLGQYLQNKMYIINNLTFLQFTFILFIVFYVISITMDIIIINIINEIYFNSVDSLNELYMVENQNNTSSNTESSTSSNTKVKSKINLNIANNKGDSAIIAASLAAGTQLAKKSPSLAAKAAILTTTAAVGLTSIAGKNLINNLTENLGKNSKSFLPFNPINDLDLSEILGLTGNSAFDLFKIIYYMQSIQLFISYFIAYNLFIYIVDFTKVFSILNKMFPGPVGQKIILFYNNYISKIKKVSLILLILFTILNLICAYVNSNNVEFFYTNFDSIIEYYINLKNK
jgi:preprotein translocase subunit SecG